MSAQEMAAVVAFLDSFSTLTLATNGPAGSWAAALYFARDDDLNLYFVSSKSTRHAKNLLTNPAVAVTVNGDVKNWKDIRGLQISGTAQIVTESGKSGAARLYLQKFPEVQRIVNAPATDAERKIAEGFKASEFFRIRPRTVRFIDNTKGFGHKTEFVVGA